MVKFISYDGVYPCLCMGTLKIEVNDKLYSLDYCLVSGGSIWFDENWDEHINYGEWSLDLGEYSELEPYREEITKLVNENIPEGCCGGCI